MKRAKLLPPDCNGSAWIGVCLRSRTREHPPRRMIPRTSNASTPQPREGRHPAPASAGDEAGAPTSATRTASPPRPPLARQDRHRRGCLPAVGRPGPEPVAPLAGGLGDAGAGGLPGPVPPWGGAAVDVPDAGRGGRGGRPKGQAIFAGRDRKWEDARESRLGISMWSCPE